MAEVRSNLKYAATHEWIEFNDGIATVGITDYAQDALGDVVFVEPPELGQQFEVGDEIAVIEFRTPPTSLTARGNMMAVGLEDGTLYVFQSELIRRRFDSMNSGAEEGDSHRLSMLGKLRRLRD